MIVVVVGLGLIGGSIGKGLIESGLATQVVGVDKDRAACRIAQRRDCVHEARTSLDGLEDAHLWVLATPPNAVVELLPAVAAHASPHALVTDTASVKGPILAAVPAALRARFLGGHPMAGHQLSGILHARADLFRNAYWVMCPTDSLCDKVVRKVVSMVYALDARPIRMSTTAHDRMVATVSHVPHVLANALAKMGNDGDCAAIGGGSWRDLTRIAASEPALWEQILMANRDAIAKTLGELRGRLMEVQGALEAGDVAAVRHFLQEGRLAKQRQALRGEGRLTN